MANKKRSKKKTAKKEPAGFEPVKKRQEKLWQLEVKQQKRKKRLIITTPIFLVLIGIGFLILNRNSIVTEVAVKKHSVVSVYDMAAEETFYIADGIVCLPGVSGRTSDGQGTLDGGTLCELTENGTLVVASAGSVKTVAEDVNSFALAAGGSHLVFAGGQEGLLHVYDTATGSVSVIPGSEGAYNLRISPDGGSFAYAANDTAGKTVMRMATATGTVWEVEGALPVSVANGGVLAYAIDTEDLSMLGIDSGGKAVMLVENTDIGSVFITNATGTQLICRTVEGPYILTGGISADKFGGQGTAVPAIDWDSYAQTRQGMPGVLGTSTLFGLVYNAYSEGSFSLYGVSMEGISKLQWEGSDSPFHIRKGNSTAYYIRDGDLNYAQNSGRGRDRTTTLDSGVAEMHPSFDGKGLYYLTNYGQLKFVEAKKKPKLIAENVTSFEADYDNGVYYINSDGTLFRYDGRRSTELLEDAAVVKALPAMTLCYREKADGTYELFAATGKGSFGLALGSAELN